MSEVRGYLPPEVNRVLYVSGLPPSFTGDQLYAIFGEFGRLRQVRVGSEAHTKGTAFVVYEDIWDAKDAVDKLTGFRLSKTKYLQVLYFSEERHKKGQERKKRRKEALAEFNEKREKETGSAAP